MWLLHFLPDAFLAFVVNMVLILGIVSTVLTCFLLKYLIRFVPAFAPHIRIAQIVSVIVLLSGVYFKGGYSTEMLWRERVQEVEAKLEEAKKESAKVNTVVETKVVTQTKVIKEKADELIKYVDREVIKEVDNCKIPTEVLEVHNEAARMNRAIEQQRKQAK
jgi:hypothetical protein